MAANVLHAEDNIISQVISAWPPLALLITVELTSRIPMARPMLATIRVLSTAIIAGIAAWVSYWHMQDVAAQYGEQGVSSYLLPVSVDGLIVVASVCLVELGHNIRKLSDPAAAAVATGKDAAVPAPMAEPITAVLATMHGKERAIAPLLQRTLGLAVKVPPGLDTDRFGTFSRALLAARG